MNEFIVPPMYWHEIEPESEYFDGRRRYAVVDGRQRLEAIFAFLDGDLVLGRDSTLLSDPALPLGSLSSSDLRENHGWLYAALMRTLIDVVIIQTSDIELIEELFSRLNEGVPLSAAERRNRGQVLAPRVRSFVASEDFFTRCLPFSNARYRHYDLLAKFMRIEDRGLSDGKIPDVRKVDLDRLFDRLRKLEDEGASVADQEVQKLLDRVTRTLNRLESVFVESDPLLSSVGMVTVYYAIAKFLGDRGMRDLERSDVETFEGFRQSVRLKDEDDLTEDERLVVEFAQYSQGTTAGSYLSARLSIFLSVIRGITV